MLNHGNLLSVMGYTALWIVLVYKLLHIVS